MATTKFTTNPLVLLVRIPCLITNQKGTGFTMALRKECRNVEEQKENPCNLWFGA